MDVLPVEKIREEDVSLVGPNLVNLAKLAQLDFPVAGGIVVTPPEFKLKTILEHFDFKDKEIFEQKLTIIKKEVSKISTPETLKKILVSKKMDDKKIWQDLLGFWLEEIRARIWKQGLGIGLTANLSAQPIFFTSKISSSGRAYFSQEENQVVVEKEKGRLTPELELEIEKVVEFANKKLLLPQIYHWIVGRNRIHLVKLAPFTGDSNLQDSTALDSLSLSLEGLPETEKDSALKVFLDLSDSLQIAKELDGVILAAEKMGDFEKKVFKLVDLGSSFPHQAIIFKLSDIIDQFGGVRGTLRLIHQKNLLKEDVEVFRFIRNKKHLYNVQLAIPFVRSANELLALKRELASLGVSRKGTLKIWLEMAIPENLLNLEDYLEAGIDGVILNLDEISSFLGGYDGSLPESIFYKKQIKALLKLLDPSFKSLHQERVPILVSGLLALEDEVLPFLVRKGCWAVVVSLGNSHSLKEHLRFVEKRVVRKAE